MARATPLHLGLARERRVYNPTVTELSSSPLLGAPLADPECFEEAALTPVSAMVSFGSTPMSPDSGRGSPSAVTLDMSSMDSTSSTTTTSGVDTASTSASTHHSLGGDDLPFLGDDGTDGCLGRRVRPVVDEPVNLAFQKLSYTVHRRDHRLRRGE